MSTDLENTTNTAIADDALFATVFDWEHFKTYVNTYDPQKHGNNDAMIIMQDMLYGIGLSMQSERYKWFYGYRTFLRHLKAWINLKYIHKMSKGNIVKETTKPMAYDALLCGVFLQELADKHNVDVTKVMVGKIGKELYVWRYDTGAYDVFKTLEIIPINAL